MKSAGRLAQQAAITRSICIAHASFFVDSGEPPTIRFIEKSREVLEVKSINVGEYFAYGLFLKHPLTYYQQIVIPDAYEVGLWGHARAVICAQWGSEDNPYSIVEQHIFEDIKDLAVPANSYRHVLAFSLAKYEQAEEAWINTSLEGGRIEITVFDVLEPEKYYYVEPPPNRLLKATPPTLPKLTSILMPNYKP